MGLSGPEWVLWWKADAAHAIHPNHRPKAGFGSEPQWGGIAYCGKDIPSRGTYPPSPMASRCQRCLREIERAKEIEKRNHD